MISTVILAIGLLAAAVYLLVSKAPRTRTRICEILLLYCLVCGVGLIGLVGFIGHVFFGDQIAAMIGWPAGSPFQFEVGLHDGAWGVLGILCILKRGGFWLATGLGWSLFMLGAAYGHIRDAMLHGNLALYNAGSILPDLLVPVLLLVLLAAYRPHWSSS